MNTEALLRVADLIDKPLQIDMHQWAWRPFYGKSYLYRDAPVMQSCGYVA
jgi:hypothetical protein